MKKKNRIREWLSVQIAKRPATVILAAIFLLNICFFMIAAVVISNLAPETLENRGFGASVYYTISMILDAGCIGLVVEDVGKANVSIIIACIVVAVIGMITFTGAVIGYITNYISDFINSANKGENRLHVSNHIVILNWNSRASEIINDLLYSGELLQRAEASLQSSGYLGRGEFYGKNSLCRGDQKRQGSFGRPIIYARSAALDEENGRFWRRP